MNIPTKGERGFINKRKHKVLRSLMSRKRISLNTISEAFGVSQQHTIKILDDIPNMKIKHLVLLSTLFNIELGILTAMLYRRQTDLTPEELEEYNRNLAMLEQEILKGDLI